MKTIHIYELFAILYGNGYALQHLDVVNKGIAFVARGSQNNGIVAYVNRTEAEPFSGGCLTVALGGSVLETFYQPFPFYTAYHIKVLCPKKELTQKELLYYCMAIRANKFRYNYGRQANKTLENILIPHPDFLPGYVKNIHIPDTPSNEAINTHKIELQSREWKEFKIASIFDIEKCKCSNASLLLHDGDDIFYVGAKKSNNGVVTKVKMVENLVTTGNAIVFIGDGQGSIGYHTYQPDNFIGSTTLTVGYNDKLNKFNALFLVTVLDKRSHLFSFGRKYGKTIVENLTIKLPVSDTGKPDWQFMEDYIKSLPYSKDL